MLNARRRPVVPAAEQALGRRLRAARSARGLSLGQLAEAAGVTKSLLSQVERGLAKPSLTSLRKIAQALDVSVSHLLAPEGMVDAVLRRAHRKEIRWPALGVTYEFLSPDDRRSIQMALMRLEPGGKTCEEPTPGQSVGEECSLVLSGVVDVVVGGSRHRLEEGDSITLDRASPHQYANAGSTPAVLVSAMYPATF